MIECPKCGYTSGNDWSQCGGACPMDCSPFFGLTAPPVTQTALEKHADYIDRVMREEIELESDPLVYQEIFEYFQEDMPIGVQKYRTGDADQWIFSRLEALTFSSIWVY